MAIHRLIIVEEIERLEVEFMKYCLKKRLTNSWTICTLTNWKQSHLITFI